MKQVISSKLAQFTNKRILIWGIGREGSSTYTFLRRHLPDQELLISDIQAFQDLPDDIRNKLEMDKKSSYINQTPNLFDQQIFEVVFKSPGISPFSELGKKAISEVGAFWSNTRLFFELVKDNPNVYTIGITGTKGKSTTATVIYHLLNQAGKPTNLVGNIGQPALDLVESILDQAAEEISYPVLELSSHQLLDLDSSPKISVIQALSPEHLDYYPDVQQYYQAKESISRYQRSNDMVLFYQPSSQAEKIALLSAAETKIAFSPALNANLVSKIETPLKGLHNLVNILPAIIIAEHLEISSSEIEKAIKTIEPLPHRLELIATSNGVSFYNDSLSTTPIATIQALEAFPDQPVILLAGGYERNQDYQLLTKTILQQNVPLLILFPTTGDRLKTEVTQVAKKTNSPAPTITMVSSMQEAVEFAKHQAQPNDVVLLSPAAPSFNLFQDYADRGNQFKEAVLLD